MSHRLYRCRHDRRLAGVAAGLAEYLDVDVTLVRLGWVASIFFGGLGVLAYILLAIVVPLEPAESMSPTGAPEHRHAERSDGLWLTVFGFILILCGGVALVDVLVPGASGYAWPAGVLALGVALVALAFRRRRSAT